MIYEIEKKYLVTKVTDGLLNGMKNEKIKQGYLAAEKEGNIVRIRQIGENFYLTVKTNGLYKRKEYEVGISEKQFSYLWPATEGNQLMKKRYYIPYNNYLIELDVFEGHLDGLVVAEVEFKNEEEGDLFVPPFWFGEEVTQDARYQNSNLCKHGRP